MECSTPLIPAPVFQMSVTMDVLNRDAPNGSKPGRVFESIDLEPGTAMVSPIASQENIRYFDILETQVPTNYLWFEEGNVDTGDVKLRQVGALVPRFKHLDDDGLDVCVCAIEGFESS